MVVSEVLARTAPVAETAAVAAPVGWYPVVVVTAVRAARPPLAAVSVVTVVTVVLPGSCRLWVTVASAVPVVLAWRVLLVSTALIPVIPVAMAVAAVAVVMAATVVVALCCWVRAALVALAVPVDPVVLAARVLPELLGYLPVMRAVPVEPVVLVVPVALAAPVVPVVRADCLSLLVKLPAVLMVMVAMVA
jgi:hypothetical protein